LQWFDKSAYLCSDHYVKGKIMALLDAKVAIVTGASSGIGRAAALLMAREGAAVVVGARRGDALAALVAEIVAAGGRAHAVAGDVQDEAYAQALVDAAEGQFGGLDVAFNNAGDLGPAGPTPTIAREAWDAALAVNLTSAFLGAKAQIPAMQKRGGGSLIFTQTFVGHTVGFPGMAAYAASKAGLTGLVQALAAEFGAQGIRANAILPGAVDTPMFQAMNNTDEAKGFVAGLHAMKRVGQPDEIARSVLYLASDMSSFQSGTSMLVDGGLSINRT
jgi:NAD(P)-dependent dehydrogenase (short-subunit alcohol dehydrogenase family)